MTPDEPRRVEVGFAGGQAILVRLTPGDYERLSKAVRDRKGWQEIDTADGPMALDAAQVVFLKREPDEHRVGFSGAG